MAKWVYGTYEINYKMAASDGKCLISTILRAAVCKHDRLGVCKMSKSKIPKLCQNIGLGKRISRKITFRWIGFLFYAYGDRVGSKALGSVFTGSRPYIT